jgi:hypothetical protein
MRKRMALLLLVAFLPRSTTSFSITAPPPVAFSHQSARRRRSLPSVAKEVRAKPSSALYAKPPPPPPGTKKEVTYDGADRGRYLFALVFLICIWQFSIPPSFRRAKFCPPSCVQERSLCRTPTCVTFGEWTSDIAQYYRDGGGIQWDFSIDPQTLAENERFLQRFRGDSRDY